MKPTTARALKTGAEAITQLPLSSRNISSDNSLTETIVTVRYCFYCISGPKHGCTRRGCIKRGHPNYKGFALKFQNIKNKMTIKPLESIMQGSSQIVFNSPKTPRQTPPMHLIHVYRRGSVSVCACERVCVRGRGGRKREHKCNGRRRCSIQGGRGRLTVSQPLPPLSSAFTFHFHSPLLLPLSALKQLPPLMQGTFQITAGGGREENQGGGVMQEEQGVRVEKGGYTDHSKAAGGGHSSQGEDASPVHPPFLFFLL